VHRASKAIAPPAIAASVAAAAVSAPALAQELEPTPPAPDRPAVRMARIESPPTIDGRLDEAVWNQAEVITELTQVDPIEGAAPTERTEVRILHDEKAVYLGVRCFSSVPVIARQMKRDSTDITEDDHITIVLDTFLDRRNGYVFIVGAAGGKRDGLVRGTRTEFDWDGIWYAKTRVIKNQDDADGGGPGWVAEIAIPAKTVSFDPALDRWGFNIQRIIRGKNESVRWASPRRDVGIVAPGGAGDAVDVGGLEQGAGISITPYAVANLDFEESNQTIEPSFDMFWQITPSTTLALTYNTDFAETEVDERQVNLTRFPLFFPEKRDFFLQDASIFQFGGIRQSPLPFFSRRIGLVGGQEQEILAGAKLTGREGDLNFGLLDVQMKEDDALGDKNLFVGRASVNVLEESALGVIVTNGNPQRRGNNTLVGADFDYRDSDGPGGAVLDGNAWFQATLDSPSGGFEDGRSSATDYAWGGRFSYSRDPWDAGFFYGEYGPSFNPALGFISRRGRREMNVNGSYTFRPNGDFIRTVAVSTRTSAYTTLNGTLESLETTLPTVELRSQDGDFARFHLELARERLFDPFEIVDGVVIPVDTYDTWSVSMNSGTTPSRKLSGNFFASYGTFFSGDRLDIGGGLRFQPNPQLLVSGDISNNIIDLEEGEFEVIVASGRVELQFSPEVSWSNVVQWDNQSDLIGVNSRLRYEVEPGSEVYVVYSGGANIGDEAGFETTQSQLTIKAGVTFRF